MAKVRSFYEQLPAGAIIVAEASGHMDWFRRMLSELNHRLILGDAAQLRRMAVRKQITDRRDARHLLTVYERGDFPEIWLSGEADLDLRQLLLHRHRMVQMRTRVKNQLHSIAVNQGLRGGRRLWTRAGRRQLEQLTLAPWARRRRDERLGWLDQLDQAIAPLDAAVEQAAAEREAARRLTTHPGVGPVTALGFVLVVGTPHRFARGRQVASYLGVIPSEHSSGRHPQRLGRITKQGNSFVRCLLVEAAQSAARKHRGDAELARGYARLASRHGRSKAKVAVARRLAIRLWVMWRKQMTYSEFQRSARTQAGPVSPVA
jgi:transposase